MQRAIRRAAREAAGTPRTPPPRPLDARAQKVKDAIDSYEKRVGDLLAEDRFGEALAAEKEIDPSLRQDRKVRRSVKRQTEVIKEARGQ